MGPSLTTHSHTCLGSLLSCFGAKNKVRVDFLINTLPLLPANVTWNGPQKGHLFDFIFLGLFLCTRASPFGQDSWLIHADIYGSSPAGKGGITTDVCKYEMIKKMHFFHSACCISMFWVAVSAKYTRLKCGFFFFFTCGGVELLPHGWTKASTRRRWTPPLPSCQSSLKQL